MKTKIWIKLNGNSLKILIKQITFKN